MKDKFSKIHPELRRAARWAPSITFSSRNLWLVRLLMPLMPTRRIPEVLVENMHIPGQDGRTRIRLRVYRPKSVAPPTPALVWLHGGGYVMGRPELDEVRCTQYVRELGMTVVSVDYRCAPAYPFPAGLQDSYSALKWVASKYQELGVDAERIAVGGESAGGGLAASLVQLAHDRQEVKPIFQLLVYPMLDDRTALRTDLDDRSNITWNHMSNRFGWESYLGKKCGAGDVPDYAVPARREDLSGLPPAWIGVGTVDLFHDEDMAYAQRLKACGVECEVCAVPGAFHGFDRFAPRAPVVRDFRKSQISALRGSLFP
ncbi:MAG: alpha/beta hydrolase [Dehalococcoidia bacterium]|nr:alpha/beta hydrolase [Dehalococcoidia bacterium]